MLVLLLNIEANFCLTCFESESKLFQVIFMLNLPVPRYVQHNQVALYPFRLLQYI